MATVKKPKPAADAWCCYVGPSIRGVVQHGDVIAGDPAAARAALAAGIAKYPGIASLIVPGDELSAARLRVKKPGNALYAMAEALAKSVNEGR